jgi:hypothetical protein
MTPEERNESHMVNDPHSHKSRCMARLLGFVDSLAVAIKDGRINASAADGLISGYLSAPAFADYRLELYHAGIERLSGRRRKGQPS